MAIDRGLVGSAVPLCQELRVATLTLHSARARWCLSRSRPKPRALTAAASVAAKVAEPATPTPVEVVTSTVGADTHAW